jgi:hypothetical protein
MKVEMLDPALGYHTECYGALSPGQFFTPTNPIKFDFRSIIGMKLPNSYWDIASGSVGSAPLPADQKVYLLRVVTLSVKPVFINPQ